LLFVLRGTAGYAAALPGETAPEVEGAVFDDMGFARGQYEEIVGAAWYLASDVSLYTTGTIL
jgi:hypothetical protein